MNETQFLKIKELTLEVFAERLLSLFDSKILVDWAIEVLKTDITSENLYILAGLDYESTEEREEYFWKSLKDLNLIISKSDDELLYIYALSLAKKVTENQIDLEFAYKKMLQIVSESGYDSRYIAFYEISEDLDYIKYDNTIRFNHGLSLENHKDFIRKEFEIFLEMENLKIPIKEREKSLCLNCKKLNHPILKKKFQFKVPINQLTWCCEFCGSKNLLWKNNQSVKKLIIEDYK